MGCRGSLTHGVGSWLPLSCPALQHYSKDKGAICTKLVKPKRKQGTKSAEEELAKGRGPRPSSQCYLAWGGRALGPGHTAKATSPEQVAVPGSAGRRPGLPLGRAGHNIDLVLTPAASPHPDPCPCSHHP